MGLVQECLESFGMFGGASRILSDVNMNAYTVEDGLFLINMETANALADIYEMDYQMECANVAGVIESRRLGISVEEGISIAMESFGDKLKSVWEVIKKFFAGLRDKILGWIGKVKDALKSWFTKAKNFFKRVKSEAITITVDGEEVTVTRTDVETTMASNKELESQRDLANANATQYAKGMKLQAERAKSAEAERDELSRKHSSAMSVAKAQFNRANQAEAKASLATRTYKATLDEERRLWMHKFNFTMYNYDSGSIEAVGKALNETVKGNVTDEFAMDIKKKINNCIDLLTAAQKIKDTPSDRDEFFKAAKVGQDMVKNAEDLLNQTESIIRKSIGVSGSGDLGDELWSKLRGGAKKGSGPQRINTGDANYHTFKKWQEENSKHFDSLDALERTIRDVYDAMIKEIQEWDITVKTKANENPKVYGILSQLTGLYMKIIGKRQTLANVILKEYTNAVRERQASIIQFLKGCEPGGDDKKN